MFKIITTKNYNKLLDEIQALKERHGAHRNMHNLYKQLFNKSQVVNCYLNKRVEELEAKLLKIDGEMNLA